MPVIPIKPFAAVPAAGSWDEVKTHALFTHRDSCTRFYHDGYVYLSNGYQYGGNLMRDLWRSRDGLTWKLVNGATPYTGYSAITSYNGQIVAAGDKVYASDDGGVTFDVVLDPVPWTTNDIVLYSSRLVVFDGALLAVLGDEIWSTEDLTTWTSASLPWTARRNYSVEVLGGKVHLLAGSVEVPNSPVEEGYGEKTSLNDHWCSATPMVEASWDMLAEHAPWAPRMWPATCVHGDVLVMGTGYDNVNDANHDDLWAFDRGVWREINIGATMPSRHYATMFSLNGAVFMTTGNRNPDLPTTLNDVLVLRDN